jgi:hypothetical protein
MQNPESNHHLAVLNRLRFLGFLCSNFPRCARGSFLVGSRPSLCPCGPVHLCARSLLPGCESPQVDGRLDLDSSDYTVRLLQLLLHQEYEHASLPLPDLDL